MVDERARYFRRLRRLRRSARRWSVLGGRSRRRGRRPDPVRRPRPARRGLGRGRGRLGGAGLLALGRPAGSLPASRRPPRPTRRSPRAPGPADRRRRVGAAAAAPRSAEVRRQRARFALRGSAAAAAWDRLDRASPTLPAWRARLTGPGERRGAGGRGRRAVAARPRPAGRRRRARCGSPRPTPRPALDEAHRDADPPARRGRGAPTSGWSRRPPATWPRTAAPAAPHPSVSRLTEATDLLRGIAIGPGRAAHHHAARRPIRCTARARARGSGCRAGAPAGAWACPAFLAARAPVGDPFALVLLLDRRAAAAAGLRAAAVHVAGLAASQRAGGGLRPAAAVGGEQPLGEVDHAVQVRLRDVADRRPRPDAAQEQRLGLVEVADAGEVALVEQGLGDRDVGFGGDPPDRLGRVPVGPSRSGPRWPTSVGSSAVGDQRQLVQVVADRDRVRPCAAPPGSGAPAGPPSARPARTPARRRPSAGASAGCAVVPGGRRQPQQQVLAAAGRLDHRPAGRGRAVASCGTRKSDAVSSRAASARSSDAGGVPDGVAFGHGSILPRFYPEDVAGGDREQLGGAGRRWRRRRSGRPSRSSTTSPPGGASPNVRPRTAGSPPTRRSMPNPTSVGATNASWMLPNRSIVRTSASSQPSPRVDHRVGQADEARRVDRRAGRGEVGAGGEVRGDRANTSRPWNVRDTTGASQPAAAQLDRRRRRRRARRPPRAAGRCPARRATRRACGSRSPRRAVPTPGSTTATCTAGGR